MAIRKLTYAPEESAPQPSAEIVKDFIMSPGTLRLEVSLDKEASLFGIFCFDVIRPCDQHSTFLSGFKKTRPRANRIRVLKL